MTQFSKVGVMGRSSSEQTQAVIQQLYEYLIGAGISVVLEEGTAEVGRFEVESARIETIGRTCDLVIVVGGDGSLLSCARQMVDYDVPLLGVNRGRLGFLTDIKPEELEKRLESVLCGEYEVEQRFLLDMTVRRRQWVIGQGRALNDVVLHPGQFIRMIEFELYIDDQFVYRQRSDGLIISTPTGSTAYALSGGGPLMHPKLDAIALVPLNAHTLSSRPIIVDGESSIKLFIVKNNPTNPQITCDGQTHVVARPMDQVFVSKKPKQLRLIHPIGHSFYDICRTKLGWSHGGV